MSAIHDYIERNPDYSSCVSTLEDSSRDNEGNTLTNATCEILNFDDVAEIHMKKHSYKGKFPSVDAFFLTKSGVPYFIEFKYGKNIKSDDINHKACSSVVMACDLQLVNSLELVKKRGIHIIVYNKNNQPGIEQKKIYGRIRGLSKRECRLQQARNLDWLFFDSLSYNQDEFEREFIQKIVKPEHQKASS